MDKEACKGHLVECCKGREESGNRPVGKEGGEEEILQMSRLEIDNHARRNDALHIVS